MMPCVTYVAAVVTLTRDLGDPGNVTGDSGTQFRLIRIHG